MSDEESFFDNVWEAGGNLVDAGSETAQGLGDYGATIGHGLAAGFNAAFTLDDEDIQDVHDHMDAKEEAAESAGEHFGNAFDEVF